MGLISSIASIFGAASKKKAVDRAASEQLAYSQKGVDAVTGAGTTGLNALQTAATGSQGAINDALAQALAASQAGRGQGIDALIAQQGASSAAFNPWITAGQQAVGGLGDLTGLNGSAGQDNAIQALTASPLYQRLLGTGQNSVLAGASATGGVRGGNVQTSLADFASQLLGGTIQQQIGNLGAISSSGLSAAGTAGQQQGSIAQLIASLSANGGTNDANLITGAGEANSGILQNLGINTANLTASQAQQLATLFNGQGAIRAGGILGKEVANQGIISGVGKAVGDVAAAFVPGGSQMAAFI